MVEKAGTLLTAALEYAARGWPVFPCTIQKRPRVQHGFYEATTEPAAITAWWRQWPRASIGMPTGKVSGLVVLDVDIQKGGDDSLHELCLTYATIPSTVQSITGGGGIHYFFAHPGVHIPPSASQLGPGLDIRGDGGYVILPPSPHPSGRTYEWELSSLPGDVPFAPMPPWLRALIREHEQRESVRPGYPINQGKRNETLARLAGGMRRVGWSEAAILAALLNENAANCSPPLEEKEVKAIAHSIARYAPEPPKEPVQYQNGTSPTGDPQPETQEAPETHALPLTPYSDVFNAEVLILRHGDILRFCKEWHAWYIWKQTHWVKDRQDEVFDFARESVKWLGHVGVDTENDKLMKHAVKSRADNALQNLLHQAGTMQVRRLPEQFDRHAWLLNCPNGVLDLRTGTLLAHDPSLLLTKCTNTPYDPEAPCPLWEQFLLEIMGADLTDDLPEDSAAQLEAKAEARRHAEAMVTFLQRAVGYSLVGSVQEKVLLIPWGTGDNGKSTFIETISDMIGPDYSLRAPTSLFLSKRENSIPNDVAQLKGIRFAFAAETPQDRRMDESLIKDLTGGDTVSARFMRGEFFNFRPECTLWLATNHKPLTKDTGNALWNRIKLIPFTVTIPKERQDRELREKLTQEAPGILAWAVRGCLDWQKTGLQEPEDVKVATATYRAENDIIGLFVEEVCLLDPNVRVKSSVLYEAFKKWCEENGERVPSQKSVSKSLKEKGFDLLRNNGSWFLGIGLMRREDTHDTYQ